MQPTQELRTLFSDLTLTLSPPLALSIRPCCTYSRLKGRTGVRLRARRRMHYGSAAGSAATETHMHYGLQTRPGVYRLSVGCSSFVRCFTDRDEFRKCKCLSLPLSFSLCLSPFLSPSLYLPSSPTIIFALLEHLCTCQVQEKKVHPRQLRAVLRVAQCISLCAALVMLSYGGVSLEYLFRINFASTVFPVYGKQRGRSCSSLSALTPCTLDFPVPLCALRRHCERSMCLVLSPWMLRELQSSLNLSSPLLLSLSLLLPSSPPLPHFFSSLLLLPPSPHLFSFLFPPSSSGLVYCGVTIILTAVTGLWVASTAHKDVVFYYYMCLLPMLTMLLLAASGVSLSAIAGASKDVNDVFGVLNLPSSGKGSTALDVLVSNVHVLVYGHIFFFLLFFLSFPSVRSRSVLWVERCLHSLSSPSPSPSVHYRQQWTPSYWWQACCVCSHVSSRSSPWWPLGPSIGPW